MNTNQPFYIVYYAKKHKKHITRKGKHDEKSRYGVNKKDEIWKTKKTKHFG